jgi:predicted Ser/Thr protein kinase
MDERVDGKYKHYHGMKGYIFTHLAGGDETRARFRFRDNPGFNLIDEQNMYECKQGKTYHVKIIKTGNRFQYYVDGYLTIDKLDELYNPVHAEGLFAFRTWSTALWWDNLVIKQLKKIEK